MPEQNKCHICLSSSGINRSVSQGSILRAFIENSLNIHMLVDVINLSICHTCCQLLQMWSIFTNQAKQNLSNFIKEKDITDEPLAIFTESEMILENLKKKVIFNGNVLTTLQQTDEKTLKNKQDSFVVPEVKAEKNVLPPRRRFRARRRKVFEGRIRINSPTSDKSSEEIIESESETENNRRVSVDSLDSKFICSTCNLTYTSIKSLRRHYLSVKHEKFAIERGESSKVITVMNPLLKKQSSNINNNNIKIKSSALSYCNICSKSFNKGGLVRHLKTIQHRTKALKKKKKIITNVLKTNTNISQNKSPIVTTISPSTVPQITTTTTVNNPKPIVPKPIITTTTTTIPTFTITSSNNNNNALNQVKFESFFCEPCKAQCTSRWKLNRHLQTEKHQKLTKHIIQNAPTPIINITPKLPIPPLPAPTPPAAVAINNNKNNKVVNTNQKGSRITMKIKLNTSNNKEQTTNNNNNLLVPVPPIAPINNKPIPIAENKIINKEINGEHKKIIPTPTPATLPPNFNIISNNTSKPDFYCEYCYKEFGSLHHYKRHLETNLHKRRSIEINLPEPSFKCGKCNRKFCDEYYLKRHGNSCCNNNRGTVNHKHMSQNKKIEVTKVISSMNQSKAKETTPTTTTTNNDINIDNGLLLLSDPNINNSSLITTATRGDDQDILMHITEINGGDDVDDTTGEILKIINNATVDAGDVLNILTAKDINNSVEGVLMNDDVDDFCSGDWEMLINNMNTTASADELLLMIYQCDICNEYLGDKEILTTHITNHLLQQQQQQFYNNIIT